jgi:hypothetical protein
MAQQPDGALAEDPYVWLSWLKERDAQVLLLTLMHAIETPETEASVASLRVMVQNWRANALEACEAEDWCASVDSYLEVTVDARLTALPQDWARKHPSPKDGHHAL